MATTTTYLRSNLLAKSKEKLVGEDASFIAIKPTRLFLFPAVLMCLFLLICTSCNQANEDKNIKADLFAKAQNELNFAAVNFTVEDGVVTLTGKCASEKSKAQVGQTVKSVNLVKGIINHIVVSPVELKADLPLKQAVDSVLKSYPLAKADVNGNTILLEGKADKQDLDKLLLGLNNLHPGKIENQLEVR